MRPSISIGAIQDEVKQLRRINPKLKDDSAFVLWFLQAFLVDSEDIALRAITGESRDKNIDAIHIDDKARQVHVIQGKFRQSLGHHNENRNEVIGFADLGNLPWEHKEVLSAFYTKLDPLVRKKFEELVVCVKEKGYEFRLYYVTTGKCSKTIVIEARGRVRKAKGFVDISIIDAPQVALIFRDYLEGVAPAVPTLSLRITSNNRVKSDGVIHRIDPDKQIESWVFSMSAKDVGEMYTKAGIRLFARNVRGYLGSSGSNPINEAMAETISKEPQNFWYYNNGVTIVCDEAERIIQGPNDILRVVRPQVINGQQTTRTLEENPSTRANLIVKVIKVPRVTGGEDEYDDFVSAIVRATNWQNAIKQSDLVSNDYIQVYLEREFRKRGYLYLRKRMSKQEIKTLHGGSKWDFKVKKDEMAQAIAACEFDPALLRKGKEGLFDERYYRDIFGQRSIPFYLSRYWTMRQVQKAARGYPERAYAKWLVLHFTWGMISKYVESDRAERKFRYACEYQDEKVLSPLHLALDGVFRSSLDFYKKERGRGEEAKDVSSFFQLSKLDTKVY